MVFEKIREVICYQLDLDEDVVTLESIIREDLGADSLDLADLVEIFEKEFDMSISDDDLENIVTVGDLVRYIEEH